MSSKSKFSAPDIQADILEASDDFIRVVDIEKVYWALEDSHPSVREFIQTRMLNVLQYCVRVYGGNADVSGGGDETLSQLARMRRALVAMIRLMIVESIRS